jgi:uncharacterized protein YqeY
VTAAHHWRTTLRDELLRARKARDATRVSALRSALAAIDNAETPDNTSVTASGSATIAGSVAGLGAAEVSRRELSEAEIRALFAAEVEERLTAAEQCTAGGYLDRAATLRVEAAVIAGMQGDV